MTTLSAVESDFFTYATASIGAIGIVANSIVIVAILSNAKLRRAAMNALLVNMVLLLPLDN